METIKRTELIEAIIKQSFPFGTVIESFRYKLYNYEEVLKLCNIIWDTANTELDEICEVKADNKALEIKLQEKDDYINKLDSELKSHYELKMQLIKLECNNKSLIAVNEELSNYYTTTIKEVDNLNSRIEGLEDIILSNDKQIQSQLSEIEHLKQQNEELHEMYSEAISNYTNLQEEHKHELQASYEKGRDDHADYIESKPYYIN